MPEGGASSKCTLVPLPSTTTRNTTNRWMLTMTLYLKSMQAMEARRVVTSYFVTARTDCLSLDSTSIYLLATWGHFITVL